MFLQNFDNSVFAFGERIDWKNFPLNNVNFLLLLKFAFPSSPSNPTNVSSETRKFRDVMRFLMISSVRFRCEIKSTPIICLDSWKFLSMIVIIKKHHFSLLNNFEKMLNEYDNPFNVTSSFKYDNNVVVNSGSRLDSKSVNRGKCKYGDAGDSIACL